MNRHAYRIQFDAEPPYDAEAPARALRRFLEALPAALAGLGARVAIAAAPAHGRTALRLSVLVRCDWVKPAQILGSLAGRHGLRVHHLPRLRGGAYSPR